MTKEDKAMHTLPVDPAPPPWRTAYRKRPDGMWAREVFDANGTTIASLAWYPVKLPDGGIGTSRDPNATLIVRAVNSHAELLSALEELVARCDGEEGVRADGSNIQTMRAHAVISKAKGEV